MANIDSSEVVSEPKENPYYKVYLNGTFPFGESVTLGFIGLNDAKAILESYKVEHPQARLARWTNV